VVVTDKTLLEKLSMAKAPGGRFYQGCPGCRRRVRRLIRFRAVGGGLFRRCGHHAVCSPLTRPWKPLGADEGE
jgi:hypothetical protein